jgi:hypothetical protein
MLSTVPTHIINLDTPSDKRWVPLVKQYKTELLDVYHQMDGMLSQVVGGISGGIGIWFVKRIINMFGENPLYYHELKSIADILEVPISKVILLQLCYECFSACTSIIIDDKTKLKNPIHIRTMDWDDTFLRKLTVNVKFVKNKKVVFEGTTWVGYTGILTGVKPGIGSVSINYRRTGASIWNNIWNTLKFDFPIGYLVRECLTNCNSYKNLKQCLEDTKLIAPCYIIMTGVECGSGAIIVRERNEYKTYPIKDSGFICQTNIDPIDMRMDNHDNILMSLERNHLAREKCQSLLNSLSNDPENNVIDPEPTIRHFLKAPILNHESIYANVMSPSGPVNGIYMYSSWIITP